MQELGCFQLPGNVHRSLQYGAAVIMLQHEVMVAASACPYEAICPEQ